MTTSATRHDAPTRSLHLIDIENQVCGHVTPSNCREFYIAYAELGLIRPGDHVVVGTSPESLADTFTLPCSWRRVMGPEGPQSADLAMLSAAAMTTEALRTYDSLILASSDGGFLDLVLRVKQAGLQVTLISNKLQAPHWQLYVAASRHLAIDLKPNVAVAAA